MADLSARLLRRSGAGGAALAVALVGLAYSVLAAWRWRPEAEAETQKAPRPKRVCADKPGSSRELLQLASSQVRWLAGA